MSKHEMIVSKKAKRTLAFIIRLLVGIVFVMPVLIGVIFSFTPSKILYKLPTLSEYFSTLSFDNFVWVWNFLPLVRYIANTFAVCIIVIVVQIFLSSLAAYSFASYDYPLKAFLFTLIQVAMMIPGEVTIISNFVQVSSWGLTDTYLGLTITGFVAGTTIFMMRQAFLGQPKELKEAAQMDGCGELRYLFRIAMPLARPTIVSLILMRFIGVYNAYFWPLLVTNKDKMRTIQVGMARLVGMDIPEYGYILAGAVICIIPSVIVFILGQDYLVKGMSEGAVKG